MTFKKILIPRPMWYPDNGPASRRVEGFKNILPDFGWNTTLLALNPTNTKEIYDTHESKLAKLIQLQHNIKPYRFLSILEKKLISYFVPQYKNYWRAYHIVFKKALNLLATESYDALFITFPMMGTIQIGYKLNNIYRIPWVVDFRDLPDEFDSIEPKLSIRREREMIIKKCQSASAYLTVSEPLAHRLKSIYGFSKDKIHVIHNGFNEWDYVDLPETQYSETFDVTYCGALSSSRSPKLLFQAIDQLLNEGHTLKNLRVCFYGRINNNLLKINDFRCREKIYVNGVICREELLNIEKKSAILVSLSSPYAKGILTSKIFEYACIGRPVLSFPPDNDVLDHFILKSKIGIIGYSVPNIAQFILNYYYKWEKDNKLPIVSPNHNFLNQFNRKELTKKLVTVLNSIN